LATAGKGSILKPNLQFKRTTIYWPNPRRAKNKIAPPEKDLSQKPRGWLQKKRSLRLFFVREGGKGIIYKRTSPGGGHKGQACSTPRQTEERKRVANR